jgi:hypothetical protein
MYLLSVLLSQHRRRFVLHMKANAVAVADAAAEKQEDS